MQSLMQVFSREDVESIVLAAISECQAAKTGAGWIEAGIVVARVAGDDYTPAVYQEILDVLFDLHMKGEIIRYTDGDGLWVDSMAGYPGRVGK